ncbi:MAG: dipeptidase [Lachnospiraceae bacterium]|nr:dipeptidase [Lachnospiraceae bacterium]
MKVIDMHCDTISEIYLKRENGQAESLSKNSLHLDLESMRSGDYMLQNFALFTPLGRTETGNSPFGYGMKLLDVFYEEMAKNTDKISPVTTYKEIEENMRQGKMSALLTLEEGGVCEGDIRLLRDFYRLGVRMMTLTWNFPNELGYPANVTEGIYVGTDFNTQEYGLTKTGIAFVKEMERLGIIIDVSHLNDQGIFDVLRHTKRPIVASHSNARALCSHPRNLPDELIKAIAARGGVIGINYCPSFLRDWKEDDHVMSKVEDMVRHIKYNRNLAGIECIGLGSDFDGIQGELELASPAELPQLEKALRNEDFSEKEIEAIFYKNVLRVYKQLLI